MAQSRLLLLPSHQLSSAPSAIAPVSGTACVCNFFLLLRVSTLGLVTTMANRPREGGFKISQRNILEFIKTIRLRDKSECFQSQ